jgi:hypothetical protein
MIPPEENRPRLEKRREDTVLPVMPPCYTLSVSEKYGHESLYAEGPIGDKPCLVTINTGASVTITKLDITAGLPERDLPTWCALQVKPWEIPY